NSRGILIGLNLNALSGYRILKSSRCLYIDCIVTSSQVGNSIVSLGICHHRLFLSSRLIVCRCHLRVWYPLRLCCLIGHLTGYGAWLHCCWLQLKINSRGILIGLNLNALSGYRILKSSRCLYIDCIEPAHKLKIDQNKLQNCRSNILNLVNVL
ncbi:hypothetical protein D1AOALGA4SA_5668, partial [Olavius algarvensis Delta 1 endosymbiont]